MKGLAAEFVVVVAGILVALGVDEWRQAREDVRIASEHLSDVAAEIRQDIWTVDRVRDRMLARKIRALETVLTFLNDPAAAVDDPAALLQAFAISTAPARPWLEDTQFRALQNSGHLRLLHNPKLAEGLVGAYAGTEVLLSQVGRIQGAYPIVVNELLPAQLQVQLSQLRWYVKTDDAPSIADDPDLLHALDGIRSRRLELLRLARNEAAVAIGQWYALERIKANFEEVLVDLAPWDRAPASAGTAASVISRKQP